MRGISFSLQVASRKDEVWYETSKHFAEALAWVMSTGTPINMMDFEHTTQRHGFWSEDASWRMKTGGEH